MTEERKAWSDVQLYEETSHVGDLPPGDFVEDCAHLILGESEGYDLCLVPNFWHVGGGQDGKWRMDDVLILQTTFLMLPKDRQGGMQNNEFIGNRLDPTDWAGPFRIEEQADRIIWQRGTVRYTCRPPYWELTGNHMGVSYDLLLGGMGDATRSFGAWADLARTGRAGYDQRCWVEGTIMVGGRTYTLENGYGVHERLTFGDSYDPVQTMRQPYIWFLAMTEAWQIHFFALPGEGIGLGRLYMGDQEAPFGHGEVSAQELEWWTDPISGMQVPVRWHVNMNSGGGVVDMDIQARGRGIYNMVSRSGYTTRYTFITTLSGRVFLSDGTQVHIKDATSYVEWGRVGMPLEGGAF